MSKYFTKDEPEVKKVKLKPIAENLVFPEEPDTFNSAVQKMRKEVSNLQMGVSEYRAGAIFLGNSGTCPAMHAIRRFEKVATLATLRTLKSAASQDFGENVWGAFRTWIEEDFPALKGIRL